MRNSRKKIMNKLFWTVFVFSFTTITAAPSQEAKNQGNLLYQRSGNFSVFNFQKKSLISALASKKWSNQKIKGTL